MDEEFDFQTDDRKIIRKRVWSALFALLLVVVLAFLAASLIKSYVTETFTVDGSSMNYTLNGGVQGDYSDGDRVVVNRYAKISRGCIVVLYIEGRENALVKRVIGVAGDKIKIVDGFLYVNDVYQNEDYVAPENKVIDYPSSNMEEITVSEGCIFVMGDNRNGSYDSREFGEVSVSSAAGKVFLILRQNGGFDFI